MLGFLIYGEYTSDRGTLEQLFEALMGLRMSFTVLFIAIVGCSLLFVNVAEH
ncbi:hypothetical protein T06_4557 [Trichinella sp. T6]|nr:hypothetical protein T06_4557 [Trichinella sp. T6]